MGFRLKLHGSNPKPLMSALGQSRHWGRCDWCPLCPRKRTLVERVGMSALCQKRTFCAAVKNDAISITSLARLTQLWCRRPLSALRARIEQIGPQVVAREEQKLSVDWGW